MVERDDGRLYGMKGGGEVAHVWATLWEGNNMVMKLIEMLTEMTEEHNCEQ